MNYCYDNIITKEHSSTAQTVKIHQPEYIYIVYTYEYLRMYEHDGSMLDNTFYITIVIYIFLAYDFKVVHEITYI